MFPLSFLLPSISIFSPTHPLATSASSYSNLCLPFPSPSHSLLSACCPSHCKSRDASSPRHHFLLNLGIFFVSLTLVTYFWNIFSVIFVLQICVCSCQFSLAFTPLKIFLSPMTKRNPTLLGPVLHRLPGRPLSLVFEHWTIICHSTFQPVSFLKQLFLFAVATSLSWKFATMS